MFGLYPKDISSILVGGSKLKIYLLIINASLVQNVEYPVGIGKVTRSHWYEAQILPYRIKVYSTLGFDPES